MVEEHHSLFCSLRDCNIFISKLKDVPGLDEEERLRWVDEVKVLAFYHFWLMQMYGPIPIIDKNISVGAETEATL